MEERINRRSFLRRTVGTVGLVMGGAILTACGEQSRGVTSPLDTRVRVADGGDPSINGWVNLRSDWDITRVGSDRTLPERALRRVKTGDRPYRDSAAGSIRVGTELQAVGIVRGMVDSMGLSTPFSVQRTPYPSHDFYLVTPEEIERIIKEDPRRIRLIENVRPPYYFINASYLNPINP